jgi:hypothetical protein
MDEGAAAVSRLDSTSPLALTSRLAASFFGTDAGEVEISAEAIA